MSFKVLSTSPTFGYYAFEPLAYLKNHGCRVELVPQGKKMAEDELAESIIECNGVEGCGTYWISIPRAMHESSLVR